jgi:hypothetical protein
MQASASRSGGATEVNVDGRIVRFSADSVSVK